MGAPCGEEEEGVWQRDVVVTGGGGSGTGSDVGAEEAGGGWAARSCESKEEGGWPVGQPMGWVPAGGGKGGYGR
jgi:hypothetical protein